MVPRPTLTPDGQGLALLCSANPKNCAFSAKFLLCALCVSARYGLLVPEKTSLPRCSRGLEKKNPNLLFSVLFVPFVVEFGLRLVALCLCVEFLQCYCMETPQFMRHT